MQNLWFREKAGLAILFAMAAINSGNDRQKREQKLEKRQDGMLEEETFETKESGSSNCSGDAKSLVPREVVSSQFPSYGFAVPKSTSTTLPSSGKAVEAELMVLKKADHRNLPRIVDVLRKGNKIYIEFGKGTANAVHKNHLCKHSNTKSENVK